MEFFPTASLTSSIWRTVKPKYTGCACLCIFRSFPTCCYNFPLCKYVLIGSGHLPFIFFLIINNNKTGSLHIWDTVNDPLGPPKAPSKVCLISVNTHVVYSGTLTGSAFKIGLSHDSYVLDSKWETWTQLCSDKEVDCCGKEFPKTAFPLLNESIHTKHVYIR